MYRCICVHIYVCAKKHYLILFQEMMVLGLSFFDTGSRQTFYAGTMLVLCSYWLGHEDTICFLAQQNRLSHVSAKYQRSMFLRHKWVKSVFCPVSAETVTKTGLDRC